MKNGNKIFFLQVTSFGVKSGSRLERQDYKLKVKSYKLKAVRGFSIIELMVVISIIGIMSGLMFANYRQGERDSALIYAAQQIAQDIRQAQNLSLAGPIDTYGYGIYFDKNIKTNYFIYGDNGVKNIDYKYNSSNDTIVSPGLIYLPSNVEIKDITVNLVGDVADIFFSPPDPVTYINGVSVANKKVEIKICSTIVADKCKTIAVTTAGRIEVE